MITQTAVKIIPSADEESAMGDLITRHERWMLAIGRSPRTIRSRVLIINHFAKSLEGRLLESASEDDVIAFLINPGWSLGTRRTYHANVAAFYDWLLDHEHIDKNPCRKIPKSRIQHQPPRPVSAEDFNRAIAIASPRTRVWLTLARYNGLRAIEIAQLQRTDVDLESERITIHGKGGKVSVQKLSAPSRVALGRWLADHDGTWDTNATQVSQAGNYALRNSGSTSTFHACRHAFAMELYDTHRDIALVQRALRHASPTTTAIYAQTRDSQLDDALDDVGRYTATTDESAMAAVMAS